MLKQSSQRRIKERKIIVFRHGRPGVEAVPNPGRNSLITPLTESNHLLHLQGDGTGNDAAAGARARPPFRGNEGLRLPQCRPSVA
ncbi:hypothetical protein SKAU_G00363310 [Synaphobranchus kaupii]|uniref:Uncharacterized protein n=1 Tax=Synaphobranchus kaupii TaxID=118154 RepID=A0A9Q1EIT1_SYNKA|nr:hypothetical protein SKAU_G00363310 [Synaphobranchus kaupii]